MGCFLNFHSSSCWDGQRGDERKQAHVIAAGIIGCRFRERACGGFNRAKNKKNLHHAFPALTGERLEIDAGAEALAAASQQDGSALRVHPDAVEAVPDLTVGGEREKQKRAKAKRRRRRLADQQPGRVVKSIPALRAVELNVEHVGCWLRYAQRFKGVAGNRRRL